MDVCQRYCAFLSTWTLFQLRSVRQKYVKISFFHSNCDFLITFLQVYSSKWMLRTLLYIKWSYNTDMYIDRADNTSLYLITNNLCIVKAINMDATQTFTVNCMSDMFCSKF